MEYYRVHDEPPEMGSTYQSKPNLPQRATGPDRFQNALSLQSVYFAEAQSAAKKYRGNILRIWKLRVLDCAGDEKSPVRKLNRRPHLNLRFPNYAVFHWHR
jgi:hypothetical protein